MHPASVLLRMLENSLQHITRKVIDLLGREMILPHHLFNSLGPRGESKNGRDLLLEFEGQLILFSSAQQVEFIPDGPEELEASVENSGLIGEEDGVPSVGLILCADDPSTDLKIS